MTGLWKRGMELSVFYEGASRLPADAAPDDLSHPKSDVWLETDPDDLLERHGIKFDGRTRVYRVDLIGTKSDARGVYGHGGMYQHGALVKRLLKIQELPSR